MFTQTLISILAVLGASPLAVADPYPITDAPVPRGSNGVPLRKNINELQSAGEPQWYALATPVCRLRRLTR